MNGGVSQKKRKNKEIDEQDDNIVGSIKSNERDIKGRRRTHRIGREKGSVAVSPFSKHRSHSATQDKSLLFNRAILAESVKRVGSVVAVQSDKDIERRMKQIKKLAEEQDEEKSVNSEKENIDPEKLKSNKVKQNKSGITSSSDQQEAPDYLKQSSKPPKVPKQKTKEEEERERIEQEEQIKKLRMTVEAAFEIENSKLTGKRKPKPVALRKKDQADSLRRISQQPSKSNLIDIDDKIRVQVQFISKQQSLIRSHRALSTPKGLRQVSVAQVKSGDVSILTKEELLEQLINYEDINAEKDIYIQDQYDTKELSQREGRSRSLLLKKKKKKASIMAYDLSGRLYEKKLTEEEDEENKKLKELQKIVEEEDEDQLLGPKGDGSGVETEAQRKKRRRQEKKREQQQHHNNKCLEDQVQIRYQRKHSVSNRCDH
ncbi:MAG: hypothetical protein EZS28_045055 [Streblomastix strix]|uniref:Uncharacterized protein n=1 Tax=Streblomastix strix TaxID=222440 RepID=A0A5J4TM84_9EUKA|nr:MAG: hypothetical protein EZS28_045055 [Streblomastix strix]